MAVEDLSRAEIIQLIQVGGIILVAIIGLIGVKIGKGTHILINSRMDQLLKERGDAEYSKGREREREESEQKRTH